MQFQLKLYILSLQVSQNLVRYGGATPLTSSFSQSTSSNGGLASMNIKFTSQCVKGFDFYYNDGTIVNTGFNDYTNTLSLNLNNNERLYAVNSFCGLICDYIQFQTINSITGIITTLDTGNTATTKTVFVNTQSYLSITSYVGTYTAVWGPGCLEDMSLNYNYFTSKYIQYS